MDERALAYDGFDPHDEGLREALTSTGNGYFCTRGAAEWEDADSVHYPGTYAHGLYNRETTIMGGRPVLNEDLVNLPNWLVLKLRIEGEDAIRLASVELLDYRHEYELGTAMVVRELRFRDRAGRVTALRSRRFTSMAHSHQAALEWTLTAENWSGAVEIVSALDGRVTNGGVARYGALEGRHLDPVSPRTYGPEIIALQVQTRQSNIYVAEAARTRVFRGDEQLDVRRSLFQVEDYTQQVVGFDLRAGEPARVEKLVSFYTSRDRAINEPLTNAGKSVARYPNFDEALARHTRAWDELWRSSDVFLPADEHVQQLLRLHISHVLQVCSLHTTNHDAGVPARGLNGEAYRGHVFWDELYVFRYLTSRLPEITRELLMYRYRRLGEARAAAHEAGYTGAMFPWQSGSDGSEETQIVHLNPLSGQWDPDLSHRQRHVNAAIFYNVWHYHQATRRPRLPARPRCRDDARDRPLLGLDRPLRRRPRPLRDSRRHGPRRVSREVPGRRRERAAQQRLHERHGRLDLRAGAGRARPADRAPPRHAAREDRPRRRRDRALAGHEPQDVRAVSRRRHHQPVRGLRRPRGARLGRLPRAPPQHPAPGPDPARRGRRPRPLQARQAGRHRAAVLPVLARRDPPAAGAPGLRLGPRQRAAQHRVLRPAHLARLDAELHRARRRARDDRPRALLGALPRRAGVRRRRRPGRHDEGGHPPRRHGRHARPHPARVHGRGDPRRRAVLRADPDRPPRRAVVPDAGARHADPHHRRRRRADGRHHRRLSRAIRVGIGDDVRELGAGERCTFSLAQPRTAQAVGRSGDGGR